MKKITAGLLLLAFQYSVAQISRNVGEFTTLKVYDKINIVIIPSNENKVEAESEEIETINKNGELKVRMTPTKILQGSQTIVKVYYQNLNDLQASQGSTITSSNVLKSSILSMTSNEGSKINLPINTKKLNIKINSGGEIVLTGSADNQNIVVNSGGRFSGKSLESKIATITSNAGGIAEVFATESVDAKVRAGGIIDVYGDPNTRKYKNVIGGKINFK